MLTATLPGDCRYLKKLPLVLFFLLYKVKYASIEESGYKKIR